MNHQQIFVNLPIKDVARSRAFFAGLGYTFNEQFSNEQAFCMVISDTIYVMMLVEPFFQTFTKKPVANAFERTEVLTCLSCSSRTEVDDLYDRLRALQEPKGYPLNRDRERTFDLLRGLLTNRARYGYLACPCRLASGDRERDRDILCPCVYRAADVREFGACYCQLYVSPAWNEGKIPQVAVPERRPAGAL